MRKTLGLAALAFGTASAQQINVKIGVLTDMSSLYSDIGGPGSVAAARLAIADFTKTNPNVKVELISGDHQNKPDIGPQHAKFRRCVGGHRDHQAEEQALHQFRRGFVGSHRRQMLAQYRALDL